MAITSVSPFFTPMPFTWAGVAPSHTTLTINAAADKVAVIVQCPKAGTLDQFEWRTSTVTNDPDNGLRMSFQTVDVTTGNPDGTQDQYRDLDPSPFVVNTWYAPGLMTSDGTDLGVKRTVTKGEYLACVIEFVSFVASDAIGIATLRNDQLFINHYVSDGTSGTYATKAITQVGCIALKYDDGTYAEFEYGPYPVDVINSYSYNSTTAGADEYAMLFVPQAPMRASGIWANVDLDADADLVLYDSGGSALATCSIDSAQRSGTGGQPIWARFSTSQSLTSGATYYIAVKPTTASNVTIYTLQPNSTTHMQAFPGGGDWYLATRVDAGAWTTFTDELPVMGLVIDGVDDGASGGGGGGGSFTFVG